MLLMLTAWVSLEKVRAGVNTKKLSFASSWHAGAVSHPLVGQQGTHRREDARDQRGRG